MSAAVVVAASLAVVPPLAVVPSWVSDLGVWAGTVLAVVTLIRIVAWRIGRALVAEVNEIIDTRVDPRFTDTTRKLDHLHDCVEGVKADVEVVRNDLAGVKADIAEVDATTRNTNGVVTNGHNTPN